MPFREKIAWLSLGGILLAFGPYFTLLVLTGGPPWRLGPGSAAMFIVAVSVLTVVMTIGAIGLGLTNLHEAQLPSDERDRTIARRAVAIAYPVLITALWLAMGTLFFGLGQAVLVSAMLGAIVLAELVRCATEIAGYRRGR